MTYYVAQTDRNGVQLVEPVAENLNLDSVGILAETYPSVIYFEFEAPLDVRAEIASQISDNPELEVLFEAAYRTGILEGHAASYYDFLHGEVMLEGQASFDAWLDQ